MKYCLLLLLTTLTFCGCSKDRDTECMDGVIEYMGDPAADGLGWVLRTDDSTAMRYYVLGNLSAAYQQDNLAVNACIYNSGQKMICECAAPPDIYKVSKIRRR